MDSIRSKNKLLNEILQAKVLKEIKAENHILDILKINSIQHP